MQAASLDGARLDGPVNGNGRDDEEQALAAPLEALERLSVLCVELSVTANQPEVLRQLVQELTALFGLTRGDVIRRALTSASI